MGDSTSESINSRGSEGNFWETLCACDGTWRAPDSNKILNAAIANLHTAYNQKHVYCEACHDCLTIHENDWYKGCVCHSGCPQTQRSGDPTNVTEYANSKAEVQKNANYEMKRSSQLIPADLHFFQKCTDVI